MLAATICELTEPLTRVVGTTILLLNAIDLTLQGSANVPNDSKRILHEEPGTDLLLHAPVSMHTQGTWRHYTVLNGLAHNVVWCINTDAEGFLWVGMEGGGICRFDGAQFIGTTLLQGLAGNNVKAIHRDPDGTLWVGTWGTGLSCCEQGRITNFSTANGLPGDKVWAIHRDSQERLWLGTDAGVCLVEDDRFTLIEDDIGVGPDALSISEAPDGTLCFGRGSLIGGTALSIFDGERLRNIPVVDASRTKSVMAVCAESSGSVWLGTGEIASSPGKGHILYYDGERLRDVGAEHGLGGVNVRSITPGADGHLWFSTWRGAFLFDGQSFHHVGTSDGLPSDHVNAVHIARDHSLWFGTGNMAGQRRGGLSRYEPGALRRWRPQPDIRGLRVRCRHEDADGTLWLGTSKGLMCLRPDHPLRLIEDQDTWDVRRAQDGSLWLTTWGGGIVRYSHDQLEAAVNGEIVPDVLRTDHKRDGIHPRTACIHEDSDGTLWFGTLSGLVRYRDGRFAQMDWLQPWHSRYVDCVYRDSGGTLWVASLNGLYRKDVGEARLLTKEDGFPFHFVECIYEDADGTLWFGTYGGGVVSYDGSQFTTFTTEDGLPSNYILCITRDSQQKLWVGTDGAGFAAYDGLSWSAIDTRDGLSGDQATCVFEREGVLWFGTDDGLTLYHRHSAGPICRVVGVTSGEFCTELGKLSDFAEGSRLTFEYTSIDFRTHPDKRLYRYKLEGHEADWQPPTHTTHADYADLPAGEYSFHVQAIDRDLNYSEVAQVTAHVDPDPRDLQIASLQTEIEHLQQEVGRKYQFASIVGRSAPIKEIFRLMEKAIESPFPVLISGETGTGKELIAKAIHHNGLRKHRPLTAINCGAIPRDLVASTLFGHSRGAFTGAQGEKPGLFESSSGGTVLLDEIGEMPEDAQIHLLRVLQERQVVRLGEVKPREVDVRIIAITNRDLRQEVRAGKFREDLYYRLNVFPIHAPSLRERPEDTPLLMSHFLGKACQQTGKEIDGFAPEVQAMLQQYHWPGNIRELENEISRAVAFVEEGLRLQPHHFSPQIARGESLLREVQADSLGLREAVELFQRRLVEEALHDADGNHSEAARRLGMHRPNLIRLMKRLGIG